MAESVQLHHAFTYVMRKLLIDLGVGYDAGANPKDWMIYNQEEPEKPDKIIRLNGTGGQLQGSYQVDGEVQVARGLLITVRGTEYEETEQKINSIVTALDQQVRRTTVSYNTKTYLVHDCNRTSDVIPLGADPDSSDRYYFTVNYTVTVGQLT